MSADRTLQSIIQKLQSSPQMAYSEATSQLSRAKILLLKQGALTPTASAPAEKLSQARDVYEAGALFSIRARDSDGFTRYVAQLQPFYEQQIPPSSNPSPAADSEQRNKITGLYLLLLLTQGRYAEFHSELESLACREQQHGGGVGIGFWLWDEWNNLNVKNIIIAIFVIGIVGLLLEMALVKLATAFTFEEVKS